MTYSLPQLDPDEILERMAFLELSEETAKTIRLHRKCLNRVISSFASEFYAHLLKFPELSALLGGTTSHLEKTQRRYWRKLILGCYDARYIADRLKIGAAHQQVGLKLKWYTGAYAWFLVRFVQTLCHQEDLAPQERAELLGALIKLIFFDLSLAIETYVQADRHQLETMKTHLQRILDTVPEAILTLDSQGLIKTSNPAAERLFGQPILKLLDQALERLLTDELGRPLEIHALLVHLWRPGSAPIPALAQSQAQTLPVEITISLLPEDLLQYLVVVHDLSQQKQAEQELWLLANFDPLTELPNRTLFFDRLAQELARSHRHRNLLAVLFLDLDDFKKINDSFGHLIGDKLLQQVAKRIKTAAGKIKFFCANCARSSPKLAKA